MRAADGNPVLKGLAIVVFIALIFTINPNAQAQKSNNFSTTDKFDLPEQNGSISFATNGSYSSVTLENNTWTFNDLTLYNSSYNGDLKVSVKDSKIIIFNYYKYSGFGQSGEGAIIRYTAQGAGQQIINLGLNRTQPTDKSEWSVLVPDADGNTIFLAEGRDWILLPDDSVVVNGLTGNITIANFGFTPSNEANLPFYVQHSIVLITLAILVATVVIAFVITYGARRKTVNDN